MIKVAIHFAAWISVGVAVGHHFGVIDGIAASLTLWVLTPYDPR